MPLRRPIRSILIGLTLTLLGTAAIAQIATAHPHTDLVSITGEVANPAQLTAADLAALPKVTVPDQRHQKPADITGALVEPLITAAQPNLPAGKNASLRVTLVVRGKHNSVAIAYGEISPRFGNHPAVLTTQRRGFSRTVDLVFPGDRGTSRTVYEVRSITVRIAAADLPTAAPAGGIVVTSAHHEHSLTAARLARLPQVTREVTYVSGAGTQTHTETGPTLADILRAAHVRTTSTTTVTAIAGDNYAAAVTPAEATAGRRPLLVALVEDGAALSQPRLIVDGDIAGGRYVSGTLKLSVDSDRR